ncbi:hypothetical protein chiPu_0019717 [Chiloscyllium punctatum]|uniref:CCHC-type domain-containing protein n=1 Tax=Chiloscyllium punctatum TaxID=137246 RepID=A0A401RSZ3_CHIPU|nr:hypothetical protein [Chiloscyllium punctatum]
MEELLREAQKVYVKREDEKQKQKAKMMVAAVEEITKRRQEYRDDRKKEEKYEKQNPVIRERKQQAGCYYCGKAGHFKRDCPDFQTEKETVSLMGFEEE